MVHRPATSLPSPLRSALTRLQAAGVDAFERTIESLNLATMSASTAFQRQRLSEAHVLLSRGQAACREAFDAALTQRMAEEWGTAAPDAATPASEPQWDALSLVDDREVDLKVRAERFGMAIASACEWELRELDGYVRAIAAGTGAPGPSRNRNPLRPEIIGHAAVQSLQALTPPLEVGKTLEGELARSWGACLPKLYAGIMADFTAQGVEPLSLSIRTTESAARGGAAAAAARDGRAASHPGALADGAGAAAYASAGHGGHGGPAGHGSAGGQGPSAGHGAPGGRGGPGASSAPLGGPGAGAHGGGQRVDPAMTQLLRRLAQEADRVATVDAGAWDDGSTLAAADAGDAGAARPRIRNLIHAHREQLVSAARGAMDQMVIDVVAGLFDQILSDPKVAPQIARQIGRLQMPVLRAAMGDSSFFASRRHPVRRLINRIASLGATFDDLDAEASGRMLERIDALVHDILQGDFEQIATFEAQVQALEAFAAEQARIAFDSQGRTTRMLAERENELREHASRARQIQGDLQALAAPDFVREFIAEVWSQVLLRAAHAPDNDGEAVRRFKQAGRDLFMSVQPKGTPEQRQAFVSHLPRLMQDLNHGMELIGWPEAARNAFFSQLLPAHASSLRAEHGLRTLDFNLMARQIEQIIDRAAARPAEPTGGPVSGPAPLDAAAAPVFTPQEAKALGLLSEESVDWSQRPAAEAGAEKPVRVEDLAIQGMPTPEAPEPTRGRDLADHVQAGFGYEMHLEGEWHRVRLNHVSPGRTFFVFTRGTRHQQAISLTHRMLVRLCENGRLRAVETAYLLERATARAREQLAQIMPAKPALATA